MLVDFNGPNGCLKLDSNVRTSAKKSIAREGGSTVNSVDLIEDCCVNCL